MTAQCASFFDPRCECPVFSTERYDQYQISIYNSTKWVATTIIADSYDSKTWNLESSGVKLWDYINGHNRTGLMFPPSKLEVVKVERMPLGQYKITKMLYIDVDNPPTPEDPALFIYRRPAKEVFVREFPINIVATDSDYNDHLATLKAAIGNPLLYNDDVHFRAMFQLNDSLLFEVWLDKA